MLIRADRGKGHVAQKFLVEKEGALSPLGRSKTREGHQALRVGTGRPEKREGNKDQKTRQRKKSARGGKENPALSLSRRSRKKKLSSKPHREKAKAVVPSRHGKTA